MMSAKGGFVRIGLLLGANLSPKYGLVGTACTNCKRILYRANKKFAI